jgi:hypothetical protein
VSFFSARIRLFLLVVLLALGWAAFTQHVWEDYYITYRASKNLATGRGLTYTAGERIHSFTSPLGVLLPATASLATSNRSDALALWLFRVMAAMALGGAVSLIVAAARQGVWKESIAAGLLTAFILTDGKTVDYTINGMETPFLLLFMAWTLWALVTNPARPWLHLGLAWAGLMWTRPDAFIYIGALATGNALFRPVEKPWWKRAAVLGLYGRAGLLSALLYLPWLFWAWHYYGSPVPHTIIAKGLFLPKATPDVLINWLIALPAQMWRNPSILAGTFMPAYSFGTGWPLRASQAAAALEAGIILLWVVPVFRWEIRVASFAALVGQIYLHVCIGFPIPWYLPAVTFLSLIALGLALAQIAGRPRFLRPVQLAVVLFLMATGTLWVATAWQLRTQQRIVEDGQRRRIGEWLKAQAASPHDTVFLEPLGYIGYFSGLKMLDFPGLSSPEVVAARRRADSRAYPYCWSELIMDLQPDWLVLRPYERDAIKNHDGEVLDHYYDLARTFDVQAQIAAVPHLPGAGYLTNDGTFEVYHRKAGLPVGVGLRRIKGAMLTRRDSWGQPAYDSGIDLVAHAPSLVEFSITPGARRLSGGFGIRAGAYAHPPAATDGAGFTITHISASGTRTVLFNRVLRPVTAPGDRATQTFQIELPALESGRLELKTDPGENGSNAFDWTYWTNLTFETPHEWARP